MASNQSSAASRTPVYVLHNITLWANQLEQHTPIFGGLLRSIAAKNLTQTAQRGISEAGSALAHAAVHNFDLKTRKICLEGLQTVNFPFALQKLWEIWEQTRSDDLAAYLRKRDQTAVSPDTLRILSTLFLEQNDVVLQVTGAEVSALVTICTDRDPHIASRARTILDQLADPKAVDAVCHSWAQTRSQFLEEIILEHQWIARQPARVRVLTLLKSGKSEQIDEEQPEEITALIQATQDVDLLIRAQANERARHLTLPSAQDAVCRMVIERDDPAAREIAMHCGYLPQSLDQRALFAFLTGDFETFEQLDFDRSLLRGAYSVASTELRRRIAHLLQSSGRSNDLTVIAGVDFRSRAGQITDEEAKIMINMLTSSGDYSRLWGLAQDLSPRWSIQILATLQKSGWCPSAEEEINLFQSLMDVNGTFQKDIEWDLLLRSIPLAVQRASLKVSGRINALAFSPNTSILAIASGNRKVALWDYQCAALTRVLNGFNHSVGTVAYSNTLLLCGERTNEDGACGIYGWSGDSGFWMGNHQGSITSLIPLPEDRLVTTGRDQQVKLWGISGRSLISEKALPFWARSAVLSPNQTRILLLHEGVSVLEIPSLDLLRFRRRTKFTDGKSGVVTQAAFMGNDNRVLIGKFNGKVTECPLDSPTTANTTPLAYFASPVVGLEILPDAGTIISAGADGIIQFINLTTRSLLGKSTLTPPGGITSLQLSPDGAFMAVGTSATTTTLWDLRVLQIPVYLTRPLAIAKPADLSAVESLAATPGLNPSLQNILNAVKLLLAYRFRNEIEVSDWVNIQTGEFDILLD